MKTYHFEEELPEGKQAFDLVVEIGTAQIEGHNGRSLIIHFLNTNRTRYQLLRNYRE